jgi:hypothetical protein
MATVALTNIKVGKEDGTYTWIDEGDDVKQSDFPDKETFEQLKEAGAVGTPPVPREQDASAAELAEENESLAARVAELEAQLAAANKAPAKPSTPPAK